MSGTRVNRFPWAGLQRQEAAAANQVNHFAWTGSPQVTGAGTPSRGVYNVLDFGAAGDGLTNDTAAIQLAADACGDAGGGMLYFPAGTYLFVSTVFLDSNTTVSGDGTATVLKAIAGANWVINTQGSTRYTNGSYRVLFMNRNWQSLTISDENFVIQNLSADLDSSASVQRKAFVTFVSTTNTEILGVTTNGGGSVISHLHTEKSNVHDCVFLDFQSTATDHYSGFKNAIVSNNFYRQLAVSSDNPSIQFTGSNNNNTYNVSDGVTCTGNTVITTGTWLNNVGGISITAVEVTMAGASISGTTLTVPAMTPGTASIGVGEEIEGVGVTPGTTIVAILTGSGREGTYQVSVSQVVGPVTITTLGGALNNVLIADNDVDMGGRPAGGIINYGGGDNWCILNNTVRNVADYAAILCFSNSLGTLTRCRVSGNRVLDCTRASGTGRLFGVDAPGSTVQDNDLQGCTALVGYYVAGNGSLFRSGNVDDSVFSTATTQVVGAVTVDGEITGAWTPVLSFGGASVGITYSTQIGSFVRNGNMVYVECSITLTSKGSSTGTAQITGLPYPDATGTVPSRLGVYSALNFNTITSEPVIRVVSQTVVLATSTMTGGTNLDDTNFANNTNLWFAGWYRA